MTDGQWLIELRRFESEYNKKRWEFRNKFKRYIRINPYSDKNSEDDLIKDLEELKTLREQMKTYSRNNNFKSSSDYKYRMNDDVYLNRAAKPIRNG